MPDPIAMPRPFQLACARAAAFTPSPTIATVRPLGLQVGNGVGLGRRADARYDVDPDLPGHVAGRRPVVARQSDRLDAEFAQRAIAAGP